MGCLVVGERLGLGDYFQYEDEEDYIEQQLAPLGVSLEEVKTTGYAEMPVEEKESDENGCRENARRS